jgi:geranylgeranyl diphosphate synthase type I
VAETPPKRADSWDPAAFRDRVQDVLDGFVAEQGRRLEPLGEDAARLVEAARQSVTGGKRFRAMFCYWGYRAVRGALTGAREEEALLHAAASLELLHASALVHDDVMDASDTRRGRPSTHRAFEARHRERGWRGDPAQYGVAAAILLGDLLLSWADELLRGCGLPDSLVHDALGYFDTTRSEVIVGQFLDVSVQARGRASVEESMQVLLYKSAKYSVERPLHLGAALAGGSAEVLARLTGYGIPLGQAFQLRDDLLGVFGDPVVTGKPAGDDLSEGKRTVLVALALAAAPPDQAGVLDRQLGRELTPAEVAALQGLIDASGATREVERRILELTTASLAALDAAPVTEVARRALRELASSATQRVV